MIKYLTVFLVFAGSASVAQADQCAWNEGAQSERIERLIQRIAGLTDLDPSVYELCENCGETAADMKRLVLKHDENKIAAADSVRVKTADMKYQDEVLLTDEYEEVELTLNNGSTYDIDAAYIYVETAPNVYTNVAQMSGCPVQGVSTVIYQDGPISQSKIVGK